MASPTAFTRHWAEGERLSSPSIKHSTTPPICLNFSRKCSQSSLTAVSKGFPASFPSDVPCANVSYAGPDKIYNHVVSLGAGTHTLWTGLMQESPLQSLGWEQAWIEIVDTIGPLFPAVEEV